MTKSKFAEIYGTSERTVDKWLSQGYIRGARKIENVWFIPNDAKPPYLKHRVTPSSKQTVILESILKGINENRAVFAEVYPKFEKEDFQRYINMLIGGGLIEEIIFSENVPYYMLTEKGRELMQQEEKEIKSAIKSLAHGFLEVASTLIGVLAVV